MEIKKKIALYMDNFIANSIEYNTYAKFIKTIKSDFKNQEKEKILLTGENHLLNKKNDFQNEFYKKLIEELIDYEKVLLFGSTSAKTEFEAILTKDARFSQKQITIKETKKMTKTEQIAFVNEFYYIDPMSKI